MSNKITFGQRIAAIWNELIEYFDTLIGSDEEGGEK